MGREETDEERLDRLEKEEEERDAMVELEAKTVDAKREMAVADALDEIRTRNARVERADRDGLEVSFAPTVDEEAERQEREDAEAAKRAFSAAHLDDMIMEEVIDDGESTDTSSPQLLPQQSNGSTSKPTAAPASSTASNGISTDMPPPSFKRVVKKKKDHAALLGIKKKPTLV